MLFWLIIMKIIQCSVDVDMLFGAIAQEGHILIYPIFVSFQCGREPHLPILCSYLGRWLKKCDDDSETSNWIHCNTKVWCGDHPDNMGSFLILFLTSRNATDVMQRLRKMVDATTWYALLVKQSSVGLVLAHGNHMALVGTTATGLMKMMLSQQEIRKL